ncbi:hypothetical protein Leryth_024889 [Lithospermum erythrorhizon]|nr:hypothetical protein Leryth_024889 [Lithospermum erythrorhizon]
MLVGPKSNISWWEEKHLQGILDKVLHNQKWFDRFRAAMVDIPAATESDHRSLNISMLPEINFGGDQYLME